MDDKTNSVEPQENINSVSRFKGRHGQSNPLSTIIAGTVIAALAVGVGFQMLRATPEPVAKEQTTTGLDAVEFSRPAARVNRDVITREELARECIQQFGREVLDGLISRKIIQQACAERGVYVADAEVAAEVTRISKHAGLPLDQWYKFIQSERGLTKLQYHQDVVWPLLSLKKIAGKEVEITREMLKEAYIDNYGPRVQARMIVLDDFRRAQEVAAKVSEHPEDFEDYAREYSTEPNSKSLGGRIPPIRRYSGAHKELRHAAFRMKELGSVSGLLQIGPSQYAMLQYEGRTEPVEHDIKDVQASLHSELLEREVQSLVADTFEELKKSARVDNLMTGETTSPIRQTAAVREDESVFSGQEPAIE